MVVVVFLVMNDGAGVEPSGFTASKDRESGEVVWRKDRGGSI